MSAVEGVGSNSEKPQTGVERLYWIFGLTYARKWLERNFFTLHFPSVAPNVEMTNQTTRSSFLCNLQLTAKGL